MKEHYFASLLSAYRKVINKNDSRDVFNYVIIIFLIVIALFIRLSELDKKSLWGDEFYSIAYCYGGNFLNDVRIDHGFFHYFLLYAGEYCFGKNVWGFRSFSAFIGVGFVFLVWLLGQSVLEIRTNQFILFLTVIGAYGVQLSQEIRTHGPIAFFSVLATLLFWRWENNRRNKTLVAYGLTIAVGLYADLVPFCGVVFGHGIWAIFSVPRKDLFLKVFPSWILGGILFLPYFMYSNAFVENVAFAGNWNIFKNQLLRSPILVADTITHTTLRTIGFYFGGYHDYFADIDRYAQVTRFFPYYFLLLLPFYILIRSNSSEGAKNRFFKRLDMIMILLLVLLVWLVSSTISQGNITAFRIATSLMIPVLFLANAFVNKSVRKPALFFGCACFGPFLLQAWIPLDPRHFSASYGAILMLLGLGIRGFNSKHFQVFCCILLVILGFWGLHAYRSYDCYPLHCENWRELAKFLASNAAPEDLIIVSTKLQGFRFLYPGPGKVEEFSAIGLVNIPTTKEQHINQLQEFRERMLRFCAEYRYIWIIYHHYAGPVLPEAINTVLDSLDVKKGSFGEKLDIYCLSKLEKK